MWIRFNLPCDGKTQQKLHKIFRQEIKDWENRNLVREAVLTYHFNMPNEPDLLYLCLDVPTVQTPVERKLELADEVIRQIPPKILEELLRFAVKTR